MKTINNLIILNTALLIFISCSKSPIGSGGSHNISGQIVPPTVGQLMLGNKDDKGEFHLYRKVLVDNVSSNGEFEFNEVSNGIYSLIFFSENQMPFVADTILSVYKPGNYEGIVINLDLRSFPKQIDTTFTLTSNVNLDTLLTPIQVRVDEHSSGGLAFLNLRVKNESSNRSRLTLKFEYPVAEIAFDEILHILELCTYKGPEIIDCCIFTDILRPLNPGKNLIFETELAIPPGDNSSSYTLTCRLWGNYE